MVAKAPSQGAQQVVKIGSPVAQLKGSKYQQRSCGRHFGSLRAIGVAGKALQTMAGRSASVESSVGGETQ